MRLPQRCGCLRAGQSAGCPSVPALHRFRSGLHGGARLLPHLCAGGLRGGLCGASSCCLRRAQLYVDLCRDRRMLTHLPFEQVNALQNALGRLPLPLVCVLLLFFQRFQHDLQIDVQLHRRAFPGHRLLFLLLEQVERHLAVQPSLPVAAGADLIAERKGEQPKERQAEPVPFHHCHIRFCYGNRIHQQHPL